MNGQHSINGWVIARQYMTNAMRALDAGDGKAARYELMYASSYADKATTENHPMPPALVLKRCSGCGVVVRVEQRANRHGEQKPGASEVTVCGTLVPIAS